MVGGERLKITIRSFSFDSLDELGKRICGLLKPSFDVAAVYMPIKKNFITIKKSGFVYGSSVRHLRLEKRSLSIFVSCDPSMLVNMQKKLSTVSIPNGVFVNLKIESKVKKDSKKVEKK